MARPGTLDVLISQREVREYRVIKGSLYHIIKEINDLLWDGWIPLGGITYISDNQFCQAIIDYVEDV